MQPPFSNYSISGQCFHFFIPPLKQQNGGFLIVSEGIKWESWPEMA